MQPVRQEQELTARLNKLLVTLRQDPRGFDTALVYNRINQYYFTGTMQDSLLVLRRDGFVALFVRKSAERARQESPLAIVRPIATYRDMLASLPGDLGVTYLETETLSVAALDRLKKYFTFAAIHPLDGIITRQRAVKSPGELALIRESGRQHRQLMEAVIPGLLREGMSEADLLADLYASMIRLGHHGVSRFSMPQLEIVAGQLGFGESSIYPTNFDGPGGMLGLSPAVPIIGSRTRLLRPGDLVFVDIGYGVEGYHSDKTQVYSFGAPPPEEAFIAHRACIGVMNKAASQLRVGANPAEIYQTAMSDLPPALAQNFMGFGQEKVKFLGHGVGLYIDEMPIIAAGYTQPLEAGMVIALEPKCGLAGLGTVGVEETFLVTPDGPECLTGGPRDIMTVQQA
jgi:Xaa-Pro dipeptidase